VWTEVADRLRQSLHNAILIRLDMAEQRHQVRRPWDSQLRTANNREQPLSPNTHIADVFDRRDVGGKLLILGAPRLGQNHDDVGFGGGASPAGQPRQPPNRFR
jgi:hypothetical protein